MASHVSTLCLGLNKYFLFESDCFFYQGFLPVLGIDLFMYRDVESLEKVNYAASHKFVANELQVSPGKFSDGWPMTFYYILHMKSSRVTISLYNWTYILKEFHGESAIMQCIDKNIQIEVNKSFNIWQLCRYNYPRSLILSSKSRQKFTTLCFHAVLFSWCVPVT